MQAICCASQSCRDLSTGAGLSFSVTAKGVFKVAEGVAAKNEAVLLFWNEARNSSGSVNSRAKFRYETALQLLRHLLREPRYRSYKSIPEGNKNSGQRSLHIAQLCEWHPESLVITKLWAYLIPSLAWKTPKVDLSKPHYGVKILQWKWELDSYLNSAS